MSIKQGYQDGRWVFHQEGWLVSIHRFRQLTHLHINMIHWSSADAAAVAQLPRLISLHNLFDDGGERLGAISADRYFFYRLLEYPQLCRRLRSLCLSTRRLHRRDIDLPHRLAPHFATLFATLTELVVCSEVASRLGELAAVGPFRGWVAAAAGGVKAPALRGRPNMGATL